MNNIILVIVAHADDEVLGCGGTIAKHVDGNDLVYLLIIADGVSSRVSKKNNSADYLERKLSKEKSNSILGITESYDLNFPDNKLDTMPLLEIIKPIESLIKRINPTIIYTHHGGDLNVDHQIVFNAVMVATRPLPSLNIKEILTFETVSSTEWGSKDNIFIPNVFVDIEKYWDLKEAALSAYSMEMRSFPHPRSIENLDYLSKLRGAAVGINRAEAFRLERKII